MKYILGCLFSLGVMVGAYAQGDTTQQQQEGGMITCMYLDENTIACFSPMEYEMEEQQEGFHYGEPHDSLFNEQSQRDSVLQNEDEVNIDEGARHEDQSLETQDDEDLIQKEPGVMRNEEEEALDQAEGESGNPQLDQQGEVLDEQGNYGAPSTENPENRKLKK